jgi:integrase
MVAGPAACAPAAIETLPPYDLRHAFASLQVRAGMSIPELAERARKNLPGRFGDARAGHADAS